MQHPAVFLEKILPDDVDFFTSLQLANRSSLFLFFDAVAEVRPFHHPAEKQRLQCVGDHNGGDHADDGTPADGGDSRVGGAEHRNHHHNQHESGEKDRYLMVFEQLVAFIALSRNNPCITKIL